MKIKFIFHNLELLFRIKGCFKIASFFFCLFMFGFSIYSYADEIIEPDLVDQEEMQEVMMEEQTAVVRQEGKSQNVTLDFKEADIRNVLKIISYKSGVNIVATPDVIGNVTIRLVDVPWDKALDVILRTRIY